MRPTAILLWLCCACSALWYLSSAFSGIATTRRLIEESSQAAKGGHVRIWVGRTVVAFWCVTFFMGLAWWTTDPLPWMSSEDVLPRIAAAAGLATGLLPPTIAMLIMSARQAFGSLHSAGQDSRVTLYPSPSSLMLRVAATIGTGLTLIVIAEALLIGQSSIGVRATVQESILAASIVIGATQYWLFSRRTIVVSREDLERWLDGMSASELQISVTQRVLRAPWAPGFVQLLDSSGGLIREFHVASAGDAAESLRRLLT